MVDITDQFFHDFFSLTWQGRRDSNPQHSVLETDALPLELLPCKKANPFQGLAFEFHLFVKCVLVTARTKFLRLELFRMSLRVFARSVVDLTTLTAFEPNIDSHIFLSLGKSGRRAAFRFFN